MGDRAGGVPAERYRKSLSCLKISNNHKVVDLRERDPRKWQRARQWSDHARS